MIDPEKQTSREQAKAGKLSKLALATIIAAVSALWALSHGFSGNWHDGVLYAAQALQKIYPDRYVGDMFFPNTSQDDFSVFGHAFAALIRLLGLDAATAFGLTLGHVAWLASVSLCAWKLTKTPWHWLGVAMVALYPSYYDGPHRSIAYAENFLTARLWAEPAVLAGIAALVARRWFLATVSLSGAVLMHPIIALPGLMVAGYFTLPARLSAWFTVGGFALVLGVALVLGESQGVFSVMDVDWYVLCRERSPLVFLSNWTLHDYNEPAYLAACIYAATLTQKPEIAKLGRALLVTLFVGLLAAAIASHWPITLLLQMQTWRVWWLVKVMALVFVVGLVVQLWLAGKNGKLLAGAISAGLCLATGSGLVAALALVAGTTLHRRYRHTDIPDVVRLTAWPLILLVIGDWLWMKALALFLTVEGLVANASNAGMTMTAWLGGLDDCFRMAGLAALVLALINDSGTRRTLGWLGFLTSATALAAGLATWDRTNWRESGNPAAPPIPDQLAHLAEPPTNQVYLEGGHAVLWLRLHRGSYGSNQQAAGVIFSRDGAFEARKRLLQITLLNGADGYFARHPEHAQAPPRPASANAVRHVCHASPLVFAILARPAVDLADHGQFSMGFGNARRYVYDCRRIRESSFDPYPDRP